MNIPEALGNILIEEIPEDDFSLRLAIDRLVTINLDFHPVDTVFDELFCTARAQSRTNIIDGFFLAKSSNGDYKKNDGKQSLFIHVWTTSEIVPIISENEVTNMNFLAQA